MKKMKSAMIHLGAFLLTSLQLANSMDNENENFKAISKDVRVNIIEYLSDPQELGNLRLVCKDWRKTVDGKDIPIKGKDFKYSDLADNSLWKKCTHAWYGFTGHEDILNQFLKGKLMYKPNKRNDEGKIEFKISDLKNPFSGQFDLSKCRGANEYLAIMTGFRKGKVEENKSKVEIWIAPYASIEKFKDSTAKHFAPILEKWDEKTAPLGLFYTWGGWDAREWSEYLTNKTTTQISNKNLYENWQETHRSPGNAPYIFTCWPFHYAGQSISKLYHVSFLS